jgi:hypothetical protein
MSARGFCALSDSFKNAGSCEQPAMRTPVLESKKDMNVAKIERVFIGIHLINYWLIIFACDQKRASAIFFEWRLDESIQKKFP